MELVLFAPEHLKDIDLNFRQRAIASRASEADLSRWRGKALTVMDGETPVAVFGLLVSGGTGTAWAFIGEAMKSKPMALHRLVKTNIPIVMAHFGLNEIKVRGETEPDRAWLARLGFKEGVEYMRLTA